MKIKELTLLTTDLLSTENFYAEVLNFKIQDKYSKKKYLYCRRNFAYIYFM